MLDNKNIQKVFSISDFRKKQLVGNVPQRTRETYREYGYFGGGQNPAFSPAVYSTIERIDYSNDTQIASVRGSLTVTRSTLRATGNSNFGYFGGGSPGVRSTVERIDYSNDNTSASVRGPLSLGRSFPAGIGNINFGYFGGGVSSLEVVSIIDRINYSNDLASASVRSYFNISGSGTATVGNSKYGYFCGGSTSAVNFTSRCDRLDYSNDTQIASARRGLTLNSLYTQSTSNSNYGWLYGRFSGAGSWIYRIDYSNDLSANSLRSYLNAGRGAGGSSGNSNFGYVSGGTTSDFNGPNLSSTERLDYSNDTVGTNFRGPLSITRNSIAATSSASFGGSPNSSFASNFTFPTVPNAGYFGGGFDGTNNLATIDKVDYANDTTTASARSALSVARSALAATGNSSFGYFGGGIPGPVVPGAPTTSTIDRIEYASDTQSATVRASLTIARGILVASGNSNFGYFGGGGTIGSPYRTTIDRIDYSSDTVLSRGTFTLEVYTSSATGNSNFGYFGGGSVPAITSRIHRIDYANDLLTSNVRTSFSSNKFASSATGNSNFGYFGGGRVPAVSSVVDRIDYANDTSTTTVRGPLSSARAYLSASGTQNFGYFASGRETPSSTVIFSTTDRINYSNDTAVASIRGPLSTAKNSLAASSPLAYGGAPIYSTNPLPQVLQKQITFNDANTLSSNLPFKRALGSFGYFGGGLGLGDAATSTVDRIDYSNDTSTSSVRGPLSFSTYRFGAEGNNNYGYYTGGGNPTVSTVSRIDYSNDNATGSTRGPLSRVRDRHYATGNNNFGYFGNSAYSITSIDRINYSNDNATAIVRGSLTSARGYGSAIGNLNFGYFGGGRITSPETSFSTVDRVDYSNDNQTLSIRGSLSLARWGLDASGNSNFGYFGGGRTLFPTSIFFSTVDRIDYSNDTSTASVRGPLSSARGSIAATGNSNFGYFSGVLTTVDRIDYSNDTQTASIRGALSGGRNLLTATTNARNS